LLLVQAVNTGQRAPFGHCATTASKSIVVILVPSFHVLFLSSLNIYRTPFRLVKNFRHKTKPVASPLNNDRIENKNGPCQAALS
jgi:hypothetical protein